MWKTSHVTLLILFTTIVSTFVTLYVKSKFDRLINNRISELTLQPTGSTNPLKMMSAMKSKPDIDPPLEETTRPPPEGSGTRWTPI